MTKLRHVTPEDIDDADDEDVSVIYRGCLGYSGCNCWECECNCGLCLRCNPKANHAMSAEQTLLVHWRACVESRDRVCVSAFADHLMELWSTAVQEDSDYYSMTGAVAPVLRLIHNGHQLNVDHSDTGGQVDLRFFGPVGGRRFSMIQRSRTADSPSSWDFEQANNFVDWIMSLIDSPATLHERSGTPTTGGLHG